MKQRLIQNQMKRSKRNSSDLNQKLSTFKIIEDPYIEQNVAKFKKNSIKINRNKLPPDFFPRTESLRKQMLTNRKSRQESKLPMRQIYRKAQSEKNYESPDKTSFFSFFEQMPKIKKNIVNFMNLKRQFESRNQPKRQKLSIEHRNFTPLSGYQRSQILNMFPASQDKPGYQALTNSKKMKQFKSTLKRDLTSNSQQIRQFGLQDPQIIEQITNQQNKSFKNSVNENNHNITFFNVKSVSFPPIVRNGEQH